MGPSFLPLRNTRLRRRALAALLAVVAVLATAGHLADQGVLLGAAAALTLLATPLLILELRHLAATYRAHDLAMREAHDGLWIWDPVGKELDAGQRLLALLGYAENLVPDTHAWLELVHPEDRAHYNRTVAAHLKGETPHFYCEYRVRASDGSYRWLASRGMAMRNRRGTATLIAGSVSDISERKASEEQIRHLAHHDQLTGLANRLVLADRLPLALAQARRHEQRVGLLFLDIDRFKDVNDSLGHAVGDALLVALAARLRHSVRDSDTIVRQGGDEFIVVLPDISDAVQVHAVARKILAAIAEPVLVGEAELCVTSSIGATLYPDDGRSPDDLLRNADTAMYRAKADGGNEVCFFTWQMNEAVQQRVQIEAGLRHAIARGQLQLHLQPQIDIAGGRLAGCEALLRWRDANGDFIPPDRFIRVAEETGLILEIGDWVIIRAIELLAGWAAAGYSLPRLSINVSARQVWSPGLAQRVLDALAAASIPPARLEVEVTESIFLRPEDDALGELRRLAEAGVKLALDDFGTGYASLAYLKLLPFDTLKIDRSFVTPLDAGDAGGEAIVAAIVAMSRTLGLQVVAEGVETLGQLEHLRRLGCDTAQGYLYSRPLPVDDFVQRYLAAPPDVAGKAGPGQTAAIE